MGHHGNGLYGIRVELATWLAVVLAEPTVPRLALRKACGRSAAQLTERGRWGQYVVNWARAVQEGWKQERRLVGPGGLAQRADQVADRFAGEPARRARLLEGHYASVGTVDPRTPRVTELETAERAPVERRPRPMGANSAAAEGGRRITLQGVGSDEPVAGRRGASGRPCSG